METSRRKLLSLAAISPVASALLTAEGRAATTRPDTNVTARERIRQRYFPNVVLTNQYGKKFRFYEDIVKDRIVTINFFFSKCQEICPLVTHNLTRVYNVLGDKVGRDVFMNSFSLKPEEDTPKALRAFVKEHGAEKPGWNFFTGKPADLELLRRSLGFTNPDPKLDQDINQHIGNIRYGNERLMLWGACPGMASPQFIAEAIGWMMRND